MKVLKATFEQMKEINNFQKGSDKIQFTTDRNNDFIIGAHVKCCDEFKEIKHILDNLEEIEYLPVIEEE